MAKPVADPANDPTISPLHLCPKQIEAMKLCREKSYILLSGPRRSGKTLGGLSCLCDHAWRVPHGEISLIAISQSAGLGSGVWDQLTTGIIPMYMKLGQGMKWVREPFTAQSSKRPTCEVTNMHGGKCRFQLESLKDEAEVEERFKNKSYTAMFVSELSHFRNPNTFSIWKQSLRSVFGIDPKDFLFLGDTNPSDEGTNSWLHHQWFIRPTQTYAEYCDFQAERGLPIHSEEDVKLVNERVGLLQFEILDNGFLTEQEIRELIDTYSHDQDLYNRYILGKWVEASEGALFAKHFRENIHTAGELLTPGNPDPMMMVPNDSTWELITSIDPGSSTNSAGCILEKITPRPMNGGVSLPCFNVLDEVALIATDHTIEEFTVQMCEKMFYWEQLCGRIFKWRHWSDRSVFDTRDQGTKKYYHQLIWEASARFWQAKFEETQIEGYRNRRIELQGADRGSGTLPLRVDLAKRVLFENRIVISRTKCPFVIQMFKSLPAAKPILNHRQSDETATPAKGHRLKHSFDSVFYGVGEESLSEAGSAIMRTLRHHRQSEASGLVSVTT